MAQAANFMRSATAPEMSAGVITANMPRKAMVMSVIAAVARSIPFRNAASKLPIQVLSTGSWASE
jgi:hypothetical protein